MNKYKVIFQTVDARVFEVTLKADGIRETTDMVVFWKQSLFFQKTVHFIAKDKLVSVMAENVDK